MIKKVYFNLVTIILSIIFIQVVAAEQSFYINISEPSPIGDRTIPMNATTNPISFTVSDSDGGPLIVVCSSNNPNLVPNTDTHIMIEGTGRKITVDAQKNEKKHLTARVVPLSDKSGMATLTFKVIDTGGLFATKSMSLTVTSNTLSQVIDVEQSEYVYVSAAANKSLRDLLVSLETHPLVKLSPLGDGSIRVNNKIFDRPIQTMMTPGQPLQVEAIPSQDWQFVYWAGDQVDTENPLNILTQNNLDIQAVFVSQDQLETSEEQNWDLRLWISDNQSSEIALSKVRIGISSDDIKEISTVSQPLLSVITETEDAPLSYHFISQKTEQFRTLQIASQSGTLHWEFERVNSGDFKLIDAQTNTVLISDMQEISEWRIPDGNTMKQILLHYIPK
ncbi:conserved hypothetical protein, secreted [Candidatus Magnetomorum sp. HK-1]|nr:conserved hypothetical protein, secreted [Candidatus Magnetomorum sp. HK-1]